MAINRLNPDYPDAGTVQLVPSSVAVGSGSATIGGNGDVSFSGVSSVSLNDVFSSVYNHYTVKVNIDSNSTALDLLFRYRVSGSDNSTSNYKNRNILIGSTGSTSSYGSGTSTFGYVSANSGTTGSLATIQISNPFQTQRSHFTSSAIDDLYTLVVGVAFADTTSFTGFSLIASTGNITGAVSVYGFRK